MQNHRLKKEALLLLLVQQETFSRCNKVNLANQPSWMTWISTAKLNQKIKTSR
jgi:hypothetical protein